MGEGEGGWGGEEGGRRMGEGEGGWERGKEDGRGGRFTSNTAVIKRSIVRLFVHI